LNDLRDILHQQNLEKILEVGIGNDDLAADTVVAAPVLSADNTG
jgi:hypothetical protein